MSGGGHRASLFALGVLLYMAEAGRIGQITSVSSVSGGSFANGAIAQDVDLGTCSADDVEATVKTVARRITSWGVVLAAPIAVVYLAALALLFLAVTVGTWFLPIAIGYRVLVFAAGVIVLAWFGALRGRVTGLALGDTLFKREGSRTRLADINTGVDHVFCATDLHAGEHFYFSGRFVGAYRFGVGTPGDLPLHTAVQASSAFPGVFPVTWVRLSRFGLEGARPEAAGTKALALHDGGVYDNMGDQWGQGLEQRAQGWASAANLQLADELVVVSASAGLPFGKVGKLRLPLLGGLLTLLRDKSVLYDNGNSVRRQELVSRFDLAEREGKGLRGSLVHIEQSPFRVPDIYAHADDRWPERAQRARNAVSLLLKDEADEQECRARWQKIAAADAVVPTTLLPFSRDVTARLLYHAYVLAMVDLHVILDYPLLDLPPASRFEQMLA
jgi:predicted acylesterase/phospholipase RssA